MGLFTPDKAFEVVVKSQIDKLKGPAMKLVELVVEEIKSVVKCGLFKVNSAGP